MKEKIQFLAQQYHADAIACRRHLHAHPELSFEEVETGKFVAAQLAALGVEHQHGVAETAW